MGEARTNLKKGSAAERLTDYLNYILGMLTDRQHLRKRNMR